MCQESKKKAGCPNTDFILGSVSVVGLRPDTFPSWDRTAFLTFLLASAFFSRRQPISLLCLLSICFSPPFFFYHLPLSSPVTSSPFSLFPDIAYKFLVDPAFTTQAPLLPSLFTLVSCEDTKFPSQFQCRLFSHCSSFLISHFFSPLSIHIIMFLLSPGSAHSNLTIG